MARRITVTLPPMMVELDADAWGDEYGIGGGEDSDQAVRNDVRSYMRNQVLQSEGAYRSELKPMGLS